MKITKSSTVDFEDNRLLDNDIEEIQKLKQEISRLQKDTRNINAQIIEVKIHENNHKLNILFQQKICIQNEINIKVKKLDKLLIPNESFNQNYQFKNDLGNRKFIDFDLSTVGSFMNYSLKPKQINNLVSKLGFGALLATAFTVAANPAQAASLTTINFDEVEVGLTKDDNPNKYKEKSIDKLWSSYGLEMSSMQRNNYQKESNKKLWLYDSSVAGGEDDDLLTGKGEYVHNGKTIKYDTEAQNNVLIIQENNWGGPDDNVGGMMKFDFTDTNDAGEEVGVLFDSIGLLDFDEKKLPQFMVKFVGQDELIKFKFNEKDKKIVKQAGEGNSEVLTLANHKYVTQMTRQRATETKKNKTKATDDNSLREYNFDFGGQRVSEFYVNLSGSGAITGLNYYRENTKKFARKVPEPTSILGLAAISGLAAASLKRKRKSSDV